MIQWLLTAVLVIVALLAVREWRVSRLVGMALMGVCVAGAIFVWIPGVADRAARILGVGRGADFVLYVYCAVSFLLIINLSLKLRAQHETLTRLARHVAIANAQRPPGEVNGTKS